MPHQVLNAKQHEREAHIVAQAGRPGTVTIATNMAGRGTDIVLGGNLEAELHALGNPEPRHAVEAISARVAGAARQGVVQPAACTSSAPSGTNRAASTTSCAAARAARAIPGSSRFYLSLEDNLMRIFGDPNRTKRCCRWPA